MVSPYISDYVDQISQESAPGTNSEGRWFHTAAVAAIVNGLVSLVNGAVGLTLLLAASSLPLWAFSILVGLASAIVAPFSATNMVLLYGDAKAEKEQFAPAEPLEPALGS